MNIFIAMNSSDFVTRLLHFGDSFIKKMIKQNIYISFEMLVQNALEDFNDISP